MCIQIYSDTFKYIQINPFLPSHTPGSIHYFLLARSHDLKIVRLKKDSKLGDIQSVKDKVCCLSFLSFQSLKRFFNHWFVYLFCSICSICSFCSISFHSVLSSSSAIYPAVRIDSSGNKTGAVHITHTLVFLTIPYVAATMPTFSVVTRLLLRSQQLFVCLKKIFFYILNFFFFFTLYIPSQCYRIKEMETRSLQVGLGKPLIACPCP